MGYHRRVENRRVVKQELKCITYVTVIESQQNQGNMEEGYTGTREMKQAAILAS